ncbi:hypothetical protein ACCO45_010136 [Purpureocillium lilacinum]|uniref:Uncharacterized protein n=1 Tax=Purpureocillium lilacinum TaxID=33203 RepID=A0ACC4DER4_PURLI
MPPWTGSQPEHLGSRAVPSSTPPKAIHGHPGTSQTLSRRVSLPVATCSLAWPPVAASVDHPATTLSTTDSAPSAAPAHCRAPWTRLRLLHHPGTLNPEVATYSPLVVAARVAQRRETPQATIISRAEPRLRLRPRPPRPPPAIDTPSHRPHDLLGALLTIVYGPNPTRNRRPSSHGPFRAAPEPALRPPPSPTARCRARHLPNMSRRGHHRRASLLPLQMQREHQVRPSGLPDGVAVAFTKEILRTLQDVVPLHQALRPRHAKVAPRPRLPLEHMARYLLRNMLVWLRAFVSISVWVCWLPWFMRAVWSFMFWISDEGLGGSSLLSRANTAVDTSSWLSAALADIGTTPTTPLLPQTTTSAAEAAIILQGLGSEDMSEYLVRILLGSWGMPVKFGRSAVDGTLATNSSAPRPSNGTAPSSSSLLGDVGFLKQLTPSPMLNRTIVSVLEGQIITVLVIVCFILVILVRDYVVQQQPEINLRAAFDDPEGEDLVEEPVEQEIGVRVLREAGESESEGEAPEDDAATYEETRVVEEPEAGPAPALTETGTPAAEQDPEIASQEAAHLGDEPSDRLVNRAASSDDDSDDPSSVIDYLRIYRRASGDSERILQIVEEEGLEDKLSYWVDVTRRSITKREDIAREFSIILNWEAGHRTRPDAAHPSDPGSDPISFEADRPRDEPKGKEKAWEPVSPSSTPGPQPGSASRPRAISDGPQLHSTVNPLGSNNWTFEGLPSDDSAELDEPKLPSPPTERSSTPLLGNGAATVPFHGDLVADEHESHHHHEPSDEEDELVQHWEPAQPADDIPAQPERQHHNAQEADDHADDDGWVDVPVDEDQDDNVDADADVGEVDGAAPGGGLDPEAIEDMEDFEGVMELIGMRGPIAGLFQNAIFCAVLVSVTIFACIFIPYNIGRLSVWVVANPIQLLRMLLEFSKVVQDASVMVGGLGSWCALNFVDMFTGIVGGAVGAKIVSARKASWGLWTAAGKRVMEYALLEFPMSATEMQNFSAISHEALNSVKASIVSAFGSVNALTSACASLTDGKFMAATAAAASSAAASARAVAAILVDPSSWVIDLSGSEVRPPVDPALAHWSGLDRFWAILAGYVAISCRRGHAWEAGVIDTLHQASGIMKVILIISIEMLVFPPLPRSPARHCLAAAL